MKRCCLFLFFSLFIVELFAQKPSIDTAAFKKWPDLGTPSISNDGRFVFYTIHNNEFNVDTLVLQSTDAKWKMNVIGAKTYPVSFTTDSKKAIYIDQQDSLCIQKLGSPKAVHITKVASFTAVQEGIGEWLIYQLKGSKGELVAYNLKTDRKRVFSGVVNHLLSSDGKVLVVQKQEADGQSLEWVSLTDGYVKPVWKGNNISNLTFDYAGRQVAFLEGKPDCEDCKILWYFNSLTSKKNVVNLHSMNTTDSSLVLHNIDRFSKDGSLIFIAFKNKELHMPGAVKVNVWSYTDSKLQSQQIKEFNKIKSYQAVFNIRTQRIIRLQNENENIRPVNEDYIYIETFKDDVNWNFENEWNSKNKRWRYLMSTRTGERKLCELFKEMEIWAISTGGKFIILFDSVNQSYNSYEMSSGILRNITLGLNETWGNFNASTLTIRGIGGWLPDDKRLLLYGTYDVWLISPTNSVPPRNLTNGFGKKHNIVFSYTIRKSSSMNEPILFEKEFIFSAFDTKSKSNGFYQVTKGFNKDPELLTMGPYIFDLSPSGGAGFANEYNNNFNQIEALKGGRYILKRSSATDFGNYYTTTDLKEFICLSNIHPEKVYNWYTSEVHIWKSLTGQQMQGVLYKPENFDKSKKYPIIFHYYNRMSDGLNAYIKPSYLESACNISIPYFVSNGYLVMTADIDNNTGEVGQNVVNSLIPVAKYCLTMPFVNSKKMGIEGFSHGGYETYHLITQTQIFSAACAGGGVTDLVSQFGGLRDKSASSQNSATTKVGHKTIWERPDLYVKNSPIFNAPNITAPLLMMHTSNDGAVDFSQAIELFTALRRLGKRVWLLEYEDGNHGVFGKSAIDYSTRMMQFFDHYLKDKPAPLWMLEGRPAKLKGVDDKLGLDTLGRTPGPGLVVPH
jgi:dipeptidyl aminopeptidase/acylaminoacyl peptidase